VVTSHLAIRAPGTWIRWFRMASRPALNRLLADTRKLLRVRNYTERTRDTYVRWVQRFLTANSNTPVERLTRDDVEEFLAVLTTEHRLAPKSRNQATAALAFFFGDVLGRDELREMPRAKEPTRVLSVLSHRQVSARPGPTIRQVPTARPPHVRLGTETHRSASAQSEGTSTSITYKSLYATGRARRTVG